MSGGGAQPDRESEKENWAFHQETETEIITESHGFTHQQTDSPQCLLPLFVCVWVSAAHQSFWPNVEEQQWVSNQQQFNCPPPASAQDINPGGGPPRPNHCYSLQYSGSHCEHRALLNTRCEKDLSNTIVAVNTWITAYQLHPIISLSEVRRGLEPSRKEKKRKDSTRNQSSS